ncbi:MAG: hypothetical protein Q7I97_03580, partial [Thermovirgaceae bacterium]|nr:hypothetical protein [Thermovirgaceae bacterium]
MNIKADRKRLTQSQLLDRMQGNFEINEMISVFLSDESERHNFGLYCALIPKERIEQVLARPRWDLTHDQGLPGTIDHGEDGEKHVEYLRFGRSDGIEPL